MPEPARPEAADVDISSAGHAPVRQVMTGSVLGIVPTAPPEIALRMMVEAGVRHLPVVADGRCVGLLHEPDLLWNLWSTPGATPLCGAIARPSPACVEVTDTVGTTARRMAAASTDAVLVLDAGRIAGIVTAVDLVRLLGT